MASEGRFPNTFTFSIISHYFYNQSMAAQPFQRPNDPLFKCRTNTCLQTRFSSCRICPRVSRRTNLLLFSLSASSYSRYLRYFIDAISIVGTQTCTKSVLSLQRRISHSWSTWTRAARLQRRSLCTITSWTASTKSRYVFILSN